MAEKMKTDVGFGLENEEKFNFSTIYRKIFFITKTKK